MDRHEGIHVGFQAADIISKGQFHQDIKPVPAGVQRFDPEGLSKTGDRHGCDGRFSRKVHADPVTILPDREVTGEGRKDDRTAPGHTAGRIQDGRGSKRGVTAELHFLCRGEPPQVPFLLLREEKCGLGMLQLGGHLLHPRRIGRTIRDTDTGRIPAKRRTGKGINEVQFSLHGK